MALLSVIRRWHLRDGIAIREICRRTGLSRNTVRKYLASGVIEPRYSERQSVSKLDDYAATLTSWLHREARRSRKQRRTVKRLFEDLVQLGYTGSYDRVAAFARQWRKEQQQRQGIAGKGAFVPLLFAPGEAFQFDWSEDWVRIKGKSTKVQVAHFKLCYSRAFFLQAYSQQSHEMLFDAHAKAFAAFGGVPQRGIYDNMKTAVDRVGRGKARVVNQRFQAMVSHYLFEADFCNPAAGWEKGQVEKSVRDSRYRIWHRVPDFPDLDAVNVYLLQRCQELWGCTQHPEQRQRTLLQVLEEERADLMPTPAPFDGYVEYTKRVSSTCLIVFDRNRYSVPASFANHAVSVKVYARHIEVVAEGGVIATHARVFSRDHNGPGQTVYDWRHYLSVVQRKPGALRNGAPFEALPESFLRCQEHLLSHPGGDREMAHILALVLHHDEQTVLEAIDKAMEQRLVSHQHVVNCLNRLLQPALPKPLKTPPRLTLKQEPQANTERYDHLRGKQHVH